MRYVLSALGVLAAVVFVLASGTMNWVFWSGQGQTDLEGRILGAVSGAVDVFKCLLPFFIARSWMNRKWMFTVIASGVFVLFVFFSLMSAIGFAAGNRGLVAGGRDALNVRLEQASADLADAEKKRRELAPHRASAVVEEAIRGRQQDKRYGSSKECRDATAAASRDFCRGYFELRGELAAAVEDARLSAKIETLGREMRQLKEQGAGQDKDPQARMLSALAGLELDSAQKALIVFVAVLVELGAAFGLYLATGWAIDEKPGRAPVGEQRREELKPVPLPAAFAPADADFPEASLRAERPPMIVAPVRERRSGEWGPERLPAAAVAANAAFPARREALPLPESSPRRLHASVRRAKENLAAAPETEMHGGETTPAPSAGEAAAAEFTAEAMAEAEHVALPDAPARKSRKAPGNGSAKARPGAQAAEGRGPRKLAVAEDGSFLITE